MIEKLAFSLGRNDEELNIQLAKELAKTKNRKGIKEIVKGLENPKEQIANDCIKVLYETAYRETLLKKRDSLTDAQKKRVDKLLKNLE